MKTISVLWVTLATLTISAPAFAADATDEPAAKAVEAVEEEAYSMSADRPTFSYGAAVVPAGHAQLEVGGEFASSDGSSSVSFPVLARVGIAEAFELRAGLPSFVFGLGDDGESGLGALQLSAKVAGDVTDSLSLGALPYVDIATGTGGEAFSQSTFGFFLLWGYGFSDMFGISGVIGPSIGPGSTEEAGPSELFYAASLAAGLSLGDLGFTLEGFTELGQYADPNVGGSLSAWYSISDKLMVDVYGGSSAQSGITGVFAGAGVTIAR